MVGARFLRVRKSGSGLRRLVSASVLVFALFVAALPAGEVFAAQANITRAAAKEVCEGWIEQDGGEFKVKKHWVEVGKGRMCVGIKVEHRTSCIDYYHGKASTKEDGKINCIWDDGFQPAPNPDEVGAGPNNAKKLETNEPTEDVEIVVGGVDADKNCVGSTIIWNKKDENGKKLFCDDGEGGGGYEIALIIINILTALVGVLGVFGIVVSGITYLTARDNAAQAAKAKKRIIQIVIGLAIFALLYVLAQWLIPGGIFGG